MDEFSGVHNLIRTKAIQREKTRNVDSSLQHRGIELTRILDNLSTRERRAYIQEYIRLTGFPDLRRTSTQIENHAKQAISDSSHRVGVKVLFSGYDKTCSVGKGLALPGSDLDAWTILLEGNDKQKKSLFETIMLSLNPAYFDLWSLHIVNIITLDDIKEHRDTYLNDSRHGRTTNDSPNVGLLLQEIKHGKALINFLTGQHNWIMDPGLLKFNNLLYYDWVGKSDVKLHHKARINLTNIFDQLSDNEKFIIVRTMQKANEGIPLDMRLTVENPNKATLYSLINKGALSYSDSTRVRATAFWMHRSLNALP